ncbi:MAG: NAD(P)/FAD-dependent oxidoreductase [Woeseiaceae bacterium]
MQNIVIVGGGFAGLWAGLAAAKQIDDYAGDIQVTMISTDGYLSIRPRLYEPNPEALRVPLANTLDPVGIDLIEATVSRIDSAARSLSFVTASGEIESRTYDQLILTAGSVQKPLPLPGAAERTWNIDSFEAAVALDEHLHQLTQSPESPGCRAIVIVGGGFTGIELATEMRSRLAAHSNEETAKRIRIVLIEQSDVIGPDLGLNPRPEIERALQSLDIELHTSTRVAEVRGHEVVLSNGDTVETKTTIVTAGLRANPLANELQVELDDLGRLPVDEQLHVRDTKNIFAAGDIARAQADESNVALMSCQHAMPMGRFAGYNAARELLQLPLQAYHQPIYVTCLDLGAAGAMFTQGWDRSIVLLGADAKDKKRQINTERIYPPTGDKDTILATAGIDARPPP